MKVKILIIKVLFIISSFSANGQFTYLEEDIRGLRTGGTTFTDFDSDGDLDILTYGDDTLTNIYTSLYINDSLKFVENELDSLPNFYDGDFDWADFNNDGHMDLAIIGFSRDENGVFTKLFEYDSGFHELDYNFTAVSRGSIDWGDFNNDGNEDLLLTGQDSQSNSITKIYINQDSIFTELDLPDVTGVSFGSGSWIDFDQDGSLDFIICGVTGTAPDTGPPITKLYQNQDSTFKEIFAGTFEGVYYSSLTWGDLDNDSDKDLVLTGLSSDSQSFTGIYLNKADTFDLINTAISQIHEGFVDLGDCDNDGDLDLLISGNSIFDERVFKVYTNDSLSFTELYSNTGYAQSSGGWGDFNGDGYLDIFVNGQNSDFGLFAGIYLNDSLSSTSNPDNGRISGENQLLQEPINLNETVFESNSVSLSWSASDNQTKSTYNIQLTDEFGDLIITPLSSSDGKRLLTEDGNAGTVTFFNTDVLSPGTYTWSVQSVDPSYNTSLFTESRTFLIVDNSDNTDEEETITGLPVLENEVTLYPNPVIYNTVNFNRELSGEFKLLRSNGTLIQKGIITNERQLNLPKIKSGFYFLNIKTSLANYLFKFVIQ